MPAILRWFHDDGVRYRAYFRYAAERNQRELVIASTRWQASKADDRARLEEYSEEELIRIVRFLRTRAAEEKPAIAGD